MTLIDMVFFRIVHKIFSFIRKCFSKVYRLLCLLLYSLKINLLIPIRNYFLTKHKQHDIRELFFQQNYPTGFNRYDIVVRYLAVEAYYGKNSYGWELYRKMQGARVSPQWTNSSVDIFRKLIASYETGGYDEESEIELDCNLGLVDGSHRMALAIYHKYYQISCRILPDASPVVYDIKWFVEHGFTMKEVRILQDTYSKIYDELIQPFVCTLWAPVQGYFDEITDFLSLVGNVVSYRDYEVDDYTYAALVRGIYSVDDIAQWKIEMKIEKMKSAAIKKIRIVLLNIESPKFRIKSHSYSTLSTACEDIKRMIRNGYMGKVTDYFHDIIIHIGDNYYQNRFIINLFDTYKIVDVDEILLAIKDYQYVITKFEVPYMPLDFPKHYPLNKDLDIVCQGLDNYMLVKNALLNVLTQYNSIFSLRTIIHENGKEESRCLLRLELNSYLIFQVDISATLGDIQSSFIHLLIQYRIQKDNFYITSPKYEILVRLCELKEYPNKMHHLQYIQFHMQDIDESLCDKYLRFDWRKLLGNI